MQSTNLSNDGEQDIDPLTQARLVDSTNSICGVLGMSTPNNAEQTKDLLVAYSVLNSTKMVNMI